jgi:hypothetical protein
MERLEEAISAAEDRIAMLDVEVVRSGRPSRG